MLRQFVGLSSVCVRPTLKDGEIGKELKRGHCLTIVKGCPEGERSKSFRRTTQEQRVDLSFSPHQVRVTVGCQQYHYDTKRDGSLKQDAPTEHLKAVILADKFKDKMKTIFFQNEMEQEGAPDSYKSPEPTNKKPKEPSTFDRILALQDSSDDESPSDSSESKAPAPETISPLSSDDATIESMNSTIRCKVGENMVYLGDSFYHKKTVWEIVGIFPDSYVGNFFVFRHKEDFGI